MDPTANDPFRLSAVADSLPQQAPPQPQPQPAELTIDAQLAHAVVEAAPLNGEVLPLSVPQYPIGLIDFNQPIVVIDSADHNDEEFDNASVVTVLKGSLHPVVVSFWKHGEQCVAQFDTDGDSSCGDYKVEQDQPYPRTIWVVIGKDGRNLIVDQDVYASQDAARSETGVDEIAGVFPLVIEAPAPTLADDVAGAASHVGDEAFEEEDENEVQGTEAPAASNVTDINQPPTEMYVAGRNRHVGETVMFYRKNCGTRNGTIRKMRRDSRQSLFVEPTDGSGAYWALNKNVRY